MDILRTTFVFACLAWGAGASATDSPADNAVSNAIESTAGHASEVAGALVLIVAIILGLAWAARRFLHLTPHATGPMKVLSSLSLGPKEKLLLVQIGGTQLVLSAVPGRIQTLHVLDEPLPEEAFGAVLSASFSEHLQGKAALPAGAATLSRWFSRAGGREQVGDRR